MSENPYAPPAADLGLPAAALGRAASGDFELGECFSDGWANTWSNFPLWLGAGCVWLLATALATATVVGVLALPVLAWGGTYFTLRMHDGEAELRDLFAGFSRLRSSLVEMTVLGLAFLLLSIAGSSIQLAATVADRPALVAFGYLFSLGVSLLVTARVTLSFFYLVDQRLTGTEAFRRSWRDTAGCKWKIVLLSLAGTPVMLAGLLAFVIGMIPAMVMLFLMYTSAYRQIAGRPLAPVAGRA